MTGVIIGLIVIAIVLRALRRAFKAMDTIIYIFLFGAPVAVWIAEGFLAGLIAFFALCCAMAILVGIGNGTEFRRFNRKYKFECKECGYDGLDIIQDDGYDHVVTKCKRCGKVVIHTLLH